jgi:hypothetical protein
MMKRLPAIAILVILGSGVCGALDIEAATGRFGVAIVNNSSGQGAAGPVVNTLGGGIVVSFLKGYFLNVQPSLDLYWTNYEWSVDRAVPTETETGGGNNAFVLGFLLDLPVTATYSFNERIGVSGSLGTALLIRLAFAGDNTASYQDEMASNLASIASYLWSQGRWLYPSVSLRMDVYLQQNFTFAFGARGFIPIFNLWTGNPKFFDEGILQITMAMIVGLD